MLKFGSKSLTDYCFLRIFIYARFFGFRSFLLLSIPFSFFDLINVCNSLDSICLISAARHKYILFLPGFL